MGDGWSKVVRGLRVSQIPLFPESTSCDGPAGPEISWSCLSHFMFLSLEEGERGGREETEEIKEEGERREGRGRCGEGGKEKTNCSLHESVYSMNL